MVHLEFFASRCNPFFGMKVLPSTDLGKKFRETIAASAFPQDDGPALANIWSLEVGEGKKDLWCGVEPAALFHSDDLGHSWEMAPALYFGTTTGQFWIGRDGGEEWSCLFESLPPIHCVKTVLG